MVYLHYSQRKRRKYLMKMLFAFVQNDDVKPLTRALIKCDISVTRISSSGGFLSGGNSTLMIGVEDEQLQETLDIIKEHSHRRTAAVPTPIFPTSEMGGSTTPINVTIGGATVFVVDIEQFRKF
jgi:uncharacterized protein YaaQ